MIRDIKAILERDPAAKNIFEVFFLYPGFHAIQIHRISHLLYRLRIPFLPRMISQLMRWFSGIEIHPGATIGKGVFIDHGMGVVIGETAIIHDNVTIFQGVTLGGTGKEKGKRHPTIEEYVVIGAGATVLGNILIGHHSRIGASSVVLKNVPPETTVVGIPGRVVNRCGVRVGSGEPLDQQDLPDPVVVALNLLQERIHLLEQEYHKLLKENEELKHRVQHVEHPPGRK